MKVYIVDGHFDGMQERGENRILVYTQNDVNYQEFEETLEKSDDENDYQPLNQFLDDMFGLCNDDFFFYAVVEDESNIEEIKDVLKCSCDYIIENIKEG